MQIKVRNIKHRNKKNLGFSDEGHARNLGKHGKARSYGHSAGSSAANHRTRMELNTCYDVLDTLQQVEDFSFEYP